MRQGETTEQQVRGSADPVIIEKKMFNRKRLSIVTLRLYLFFVLSQYANSSFSFIILWVFIPALFQQPAD